MGGTPIFSFASSTELVQSAAAAVGVNVYGLSPIATAVIGVVFGFAVLAMITGFFLKWSRGRSR